MKINKWVFVILCIILIAGVFVLFTPQMITNNKIYYVENNKIMSAGISINKFSEYGGLFLINTGLIEIFRGSASLVDIRKEYSLNEEFGISSIIKSKDKNQFFAIKYNKDDTNRYIIKLEGKKEEVLKVFPEHFKIV